MLHYIFFGGCDCITLKTALFDRSHTSSYSSLLLMMMMMMMIVTMAVSCTVFEVKRDFCRNIGRKHWSKNANFSNCTVPRALRWCKSIAEKFNRLSRAHERFRQTTDRQTDRQTDETTNGGSRYSRT